MTHASKSSRVELQFHFYNLTSAAAWNSCKAIIKIHCFQLIVSFLWSFPIHPVFTWFDQLLEFKRNENIEPPISLCTDLTLKFSIKGKIIFQAFYLINFHVLWKQNFHGFQVKKPSINYKKNEKSEGFWSWKKYKNKNIERKKNQNQDQTEQDSLSILYP